MNGTNKKFDIILSQADQEINIANEFGIFEDLNINIWVFFCLAISFCYLLFILYTELRFWYRKYFYNKCLNDVIDAPTSPDEDLNGKLVFLVGKLEFSSPVYFYDPVLPFFEITGVGLLRRQVEMFQWDLSAEKKYEKIWKNQPVRVRSKQFKNPSWLGKYKNEDIAKDLDLAVCNIKLSQECVKLLQEKGTFRSMNPLDVCQKSSEFNLVSDSHYYYLTRGNEAPEIGDYRFRYFYLELGTYATVLGEYRNGKIGKYRNSLIFAENGVVSVESLFNKLKIEDTFKQNIFRLFGVLSLLIGIVLLTSN